MLELLTNITFIHNISGAISNDFNSPFGSIIGDISAGPNSTSNLISLMPGNLNTASKLTSAEFNQFVEAGNDVSINFEFVHEIKIKRTMKDQGATCTIQFPRNMNFAGINLTRNKNITGQNPLISINDRVIIKLGYSLSNGGTGVVTQFIGYVSKINLGTPLMIECSDLMFGLKQINCNIPAGYFTLKQLITNCLITNINIPAAQNTFCIAQHITDLNNEDSLSALENVNTQIPIWIPTDTPAFLYSSVRTTKTVAEVLSDIKSMFGIFVYFDDYGNLHLELPFINSQKILKNNNFLFENQIIDDKGLKWSDANTMLVKAICKSKNPDPSKPVIISNNSSCINQGQIVSFTGIPGLDPVVTLGPIDFNLNKTTGYVGDLNGEEIIINMPDGLSQVACDYWALQTLIANKYTGYAPGSHFETFFQPSVYVGQQITIKSIVFPEKSGTFQCVGTEKTFGVNGGRQRIEIGQVLPDQTNLENFTNIINKNFPQLLNLIQKPA